MRPSKNEKPTDEPGRNPPPRTRPNGNGVQKKTPAGEERRTNKQKRNSQWRHSGTMQVLEEPPAQSTHLGRELLLLNSTGTWAQFMGLDFQKTLAFSHSKNFLPSPGTGSRPKWQYATVSRDLGSRKTKDMAKAPGRQSNLNDSQGPEP
eukprot:UN4393